jgi:hypothetical protein
MTEKSPSACLSRRERESETRDRIETQVRMVMQGNSGGEVQENLAAAAEFVHKQQQQQRPASTSATGVCTLRRSEMACLKTALSVIVLKRRFAAAVNPWCLPKRSKPLRTNASNSSSSSSGSIDAVRDALMAVTGDALLVPKVATAATCATTVAAISRSSSSLNGTSMTASASGTKRVGDGTSASARSTVRFSDTQQPLNAPFMENTSQQLLPLALDNKNWESHLQHILQLIWRRHHPMNTTSNLHHSSWDGLCVHVACQLEQAAAAQGATTTVVADWLYTQWTSFRSVPLHTMTAAANSDPSADNALQQQSSWRWTSIWQTILQAKPEILSELMVPVLLKLLLSSPSSSASAPTNDASTSSNAITTALTTTTVRLESAHLLHLLEQALEKAPRHVIAETLETLLPAAQPPNNNNSQSYHGSGPLSLLPSVNSSWFSTQDLAFDYHYCCHQQQQTATVAGPHFLLGHGLAAISERLTLSLSLPSSYYYDGGAYGMMDDRNCDYYHDATGGMMGDDTQDVEIGTTPASSYNASRPETRVRSKS